MFWTSLEVFISNVLHRPKNLLHAKWQLLLWCIVTSTRLWLPLKSLPRQGQSLTGVAAACPTIPNNPPHPPTPLQDISTPSPPLLAPITAPYKQKVFPPCVDKGGKKAGKNSLTREHSSSLSLSLLCILAACTHYEPPLWTADCWHIRRGGVVRGVGGSNSEFGTTALSFKTTPSITPP